MDPSTSAMDLEMPDAPTPQELSAVKHYEKSGIRQSQANKETWHPTMEVRTDKSWVEIMAVALCMERKYHVAMRSLWPKNGGDFLTLAAWKAALHLPKRYARYKSFDAWANNWYTPSRRQQVLDMAEQLFNRHASTNAIRFTTEGANLRIPDTDIETNKLRDGLFLFQVTRQKLLSTVKSLQDLEQLLSERLSDSLIASQQSGVAHLIKQMRDIDKAKKDTQKVLQDSKLNEAAVEIIDTLLDKHIRPMGDHLCDEPSAGQLETVARSEQELNQLDAEILESDLRAMPQLCGLKPSFYEGWQENKLPSVTFRAGSTKGLQKGLDLSDAQTIAPIGMAEYQKLDDQSAAWLKRDVKDINIPRLIVAYKEFVGLVERSETMARHKPFNAFIGYSRQKTFELAADNIIHVRKLAILVFNKLDLASPTDAEGRDISWRPIVNRKLRRLYCLLAIMYGNTREPALWLVTMDWLLEDLARMVVGYADPALETIRMQRFREIVSSAAVPTLPSRADKTIIAQLERHRLARELFGELALFYRGTVILLFTGVSVGSSRLNSRSQQETTETWYTELLKWSSTCGHTGCFEAIQSDYVEGAKYRRYGVSVGILDPRIGAPNVRAVFSTNRRDAYPCLSQLMHYKKWNKAWGPFFHWFAHLWHPSCKAARGKDALITDIRHVLGQA